MINEEDWFVEYKKLSKDEKELYKEFILDSEEKTTVLDYERFIGAIEIIASCPNDLWVKYNRKVNVAEEVALTFDNECICIASYLKNKKCISEEIYNLVMQINEQLTILSNEHNEKNWTIQAMNNDRRWVGIRAIANEVYKLLDCNR